MFDPIFEIFNLLFSNPITNLFVINYQVFNSINLPFAFGFSIIGLTIFLRLVLYPFTTAQLKSAHKMQKVAPKLSEIKEKYKDDKKKQQEEIMRMYREEGVNPAAGCLPLLIQMPFIFALYHVLINAVNITAESLSSINNVLYFDFIRLTSVWDTSFFGVSLGMSPIDAFSANPAIAILPFLTGVSQYLLSKMMMPDQALETEKAIAKTTKEKGDDFQASFQKQATYIFPIMIAVFSFTLPSGLSLYWITFTVFGILQQYILLGPGGAASIFKKLNLNGRSK